MIVVVAPPCIVVQINSSSCSGRVVSRRLLAAGYVTDQQQSRQVFYLLSHQVTSNLERAPPPHIRAFWSSLDHRDMLAVTHSRLPRGQRRRPDEQLKM
eukprot:4103078-Pyramimonas_sp.AAC.2